MEKIAQMALLADFYGPLLTGKQRNAWDLHFEQDLSLAEIAEVEQTSRQAVHDLLKRTERILLEYEEKLGLVQRFISEREKLLEIGEMLAEMKENDFADAAALKRHRLIRAKLEDILQEL